MTITIKQWSDTLLSWISEASFATDLTASNNICWIFLFGDPFDIFNNPFIWSCFTGCWDCTRFVMTSSNGNICVSCPMVTSELPSQKPATWSLDVFFHLWLNQWLSKQSWDWWFETPSCSLWRHCNVGHWNEILEQYYLYQATLAGRI